MPRFFDDYSNTYLTHDSSAGRKQQRRGWKFRENFRLHYEPYVEKWRRGPMGLASAQQAFLKVRGSSDPAVPPLPPGWKEQVDEVIGISYYIDTNTGKRSWVRPGFIPPPPGQGPPGGGPPGSRMPPPMGGHNQPPGGHFNRAGPPPAGNNNSNNRLAGIGALQQQQQQQRGGPPPPYFGPGSAGGAAPQPQAGTHPSFNSNPAAAGGMVGVGPSQPPPNVHLPPPPQMPPQG